MKKKLTWLTLFLPFFIWAQKNIESAEKDTVKDSTYESTETNEKKVYYLNSLSVNGVNKYTDNQIMNFTGLKKGQEIEIPSGNSISYAIKKLWRTKLFSDVSFQIGQIDGDKIDLIVVLEPLQDLNKISTEGIKKSKLEELIGEKEKSTETKKITQNFLSQIKSKVTNYYINKGYPDVQVTFKETPLPSDKDLVDLLVKVDKGPRVKIKSIKFYNNTHLSSRKLLSSKVLKKTRKKGNPKNILKPSKYIPELYKEDLKKIEDAYASKGYRDAKVIANEVRRVDKNNYAIDIHIEEGKKYYLGDVEFIGNSAFSTEELRKILTYKKGDSFDAVGLNLKIQGSDKDDDIQTLYLDNGYLFARVNAVEKSIDNDTINLEIRIIEGLPARINKVTFSGNHQTHDKVIVRTLDTRPGDLFSKRDLKSSYFSLAQSGLFDPQGTSYDIQPNPENNTVDITWKLTERGSSQIELQGGYGNGRLIGTVGLTFNNFSLSGVFKKDAWRPIPMGDGQQLSLRAQVGNNYQNYSISFVEPWLGGKSPTSLSTSFYYSRLAQNTGNDEKSILNIIGTSVGIVKRLNWPDRFFRLSQSVAYQNYTFQEYPINVGVLTFDNGFSNNLNYSISLSRQSAGPDPIFPTSGSNFSIGLKATLPYSLFNNIDYSQVSVEEKIKWLEFYKIKFNGTWYKEIVGKLTLKAEGEFGYLGAYNTARGVSPFERFFVGGTGLVGNRFDGREIIPLRGYQDPSTTGGIVGRDITPSGGGTIFNKFQLELRYPIITGQTKIWALVFGEAGNTWESHKDYNPFELKRSAGFGVRIFMPAFGLLGFDFGYGFDKPLFQTSPSGWQTHFVFGQQF